MCIRDRLNVYPGAYRLPGSDKADVSRRMQVGVEVWLEVKLEQWTSLAAVLPSEDSEDEDEEELVSLDIIIST